MSATTEKELRPPVPRFRGDSLERARERLEHLYEISSLFVAFEDLEGTFDEAIGIAARTLAIRSAVVIEELPDGPRVMVWPSRDRSDAAIAAATANAERAYAYLRGTTLQALGSGLIRKLGNTVLPGVDGEASGSARFIVIPIVVGRRPVFGALQIESVDPLTEGDVIFVNAVANQLAVALERRRAWDEDIERRTDAEEGQAGAEVARDVAEAGRASAEVRERSAAHQRERAVALLERFEGLVDGLHDLFVWEAEPDTHQPLFVSAGLDPLLGFPRTDWIATGAPWEAHAHPDDRALVRATLEEALATGRDQRCEHRLLAADGREVWFRTGVHRADEHGDVRLQGVTVDVTAEKQAQESLRAQLDFVRAVASSLGEGVIAVDLLERVTFVNEAATRILGTTKAEAYGAELSTLLRMTASSGAPIESGLAAVLRTGAPSRSDRAVVVSRDGTHRPVSFTAAPIRSGGELTGAVIAFDDITERRAIEEGRRFLLAASQTLGAALDLSTTAERLARLLVPRLGDFASVAVLRDGRLERLAWAHADPERAAALAPLVEALAPVALDEHLAATAVQAATLELVSEDVAAWAAQIPDAGHRMLVRALDPRAMLVVPMAIGPRMIGAITLALEGADRSFDPTSVALAEELARRAAYAIEHGRLYAQAQHDAAVREQILAVVSHDLRSPLASMLMAADLLEDLRVVEADQEAFTRWVRVLTRTGRHAQRLIGDLLDFGSIEAGRLSIELTRLAPVALAKEAFESFDAIAREKGVHLALEAQASDALVLGDRDRALQVIGNLLGNAIKVSPEGGTVTLGAEARDGEVRFFVRDEGPGLEPAELAHIFERYWRGDDPGYAGTGLGLAIAAGIVAAHRGRIWADSVPGQGATFSFTLPTTGA